MTALRESVTNQPGTAPDPENRLLVCAPNWLGDALMALPAIRGLCRLRQPSAVTVLCKPSLLELWPLFTEKVRIMTLHRGPRGMWSTICRLRAERFTHAIILPNSFRSAWLPFAAGIPMRRGQAGHQRRWLLTETVARSREKATRHQSREFADVAGVVCAGETTPLVAVPHASRATALERLAPVAGHPLLMLFPGAARGPSKRWPPDAFADLGRLWHNDFHGAVLVAGTIAEYTLCERVARGIGDRVLNLAGKTRLTELAALVEQCSVAVGNDSGGAHLAAALARPTVVIFGQTDPAVTGPQGAAVRIIAAPATHTDRDIPRAAREAQELLASISVQTVYRAVRELMNNKSLQKDAK